MKSATKFFALLLAFSAILAITGCGQAKPSSPPTAGGIQTHIRKLYFDIPEGSVGNKYNGTFSTWEFFTEDYDKPGVDILLSISVMGDKTIDDYVRNDSRPSRSKGVTPFKKEKINGQTWYTCNNGEIWYFASTIDEKNIYEIEVKSVAGDPQKLRDKAIKMLYKTLYFE